MKSLRRELTSAMNQHCGFEITVCKAAGPKQKTKKDLCGKERASRRAIQNTPTISRDCYTKDLKEGVGAKQKPSYKNFSETKVKNTGLKRSNHSQIGKGRAGTNKHKEHKRFPRLVKTTIGTGGTTVKRRRRQGEVAPGNRERVGSENAASEEKKIFGHVGPTGQRGQMRGKRTGRRFEVKVRRDL